MEEYDYRDVKVGGVAERQTRGIAKPAAPIELTESQKARMLRQQQFREAFYKLERLHEELTQFSVSHHYFKEATKERWTTLTEETLEGMRPFLPRDSAGEESSPENNSYR